MCAFPARAVGTPGQLLIHLADAILMVYLYTGFGVFSSKFHKLGESHVCKVFLFLHVLLVSLITVNHDGTLPPTTAIGPRSLSRAGPLASLQPLKIKRGAKYVHVFRTCKVHLHPQLIFMQRRDDRVQLHQCSEIVYLAKRFSNTKDHTCIKFSLWHVLHVALVTIIIMEGAHP